jgi:hypothetical protein
MSRRKKWALMSAGLIILFSVSFVYFYKTFQAKAKNEPPIFPPSALNKPLPKTHLVDVTGAELDSSEFQKGKVVLVVVTEGCHLCLDEAEFINTVMNLRDDVRFYGVVPFGADRSVLKSAEARFPFKLYFDEGGMLGDAFRIDKVPIKLYLEGGILKKGWGGASSNESKKAEFKQWLGSI